MYQNQKQKISKRGLGAKSASNQATENIVPHPQAVVRNKRIKYLAKRPPKSTPGEKPVSSVDQSRVDRSQKAQPKTETHTPLATGVRIPNAFLNCALGVMRDVSTGNDRTKSKEYQEIPHRNGCSVSWCGERLDQFDIEVYILVLNLLNEVSQVDVRLSQLARELGVHNDSRSRERIKDCLRRLGYSSKYQITTTIYFTKTKDAPKRKREKRVVKRSGSLLDIERIGIGTSAMYRIKFPTNFKELYTVGNFGSLNFQAHRRLNSVLAKRLHWYVSGQKRDKQHKVSLYELRTYLGYEQCGLSGMRDFKNRLLDALSDLRVQRIVRDSAIVDGLVMWIRL